MLDPVKRSDNSLKQVVKVVGDATCELAYRLHFLGLAQLLFYDFQLAVASVMTLTKQRFTMSGDRDVVNLDQADATAPFRPNGRMETSWTRSSPGRGVQRKQTTDAESASKYWKHRIQVPPTLMPQIAANAYAETT